MPVYNLTWGGTTDAEKYGMFDLAGQADFGNIHFYPNGQPYAKLQTSLAANYHHVLPSQIVMTETGYDTAQVSENAQAILNVNLYLGAFQQGVPKTYIYELYDEWQTYGLFRAGFAPKPAATAIHNMTTILADTGTLAQPGQLNYSVVGLPSSGHTLLLQKSNGKFELVIWNESPPQRQRGHGGAGRGHGATRSDRFERERVRRRARNRRYPKCGEVIERSVDPWRNRFDLGDQHLKLGLTLGE